MKQISKTFSAGFAMVLATACGGTDNERLTVDETGTMSAALTPQCDVVSGRVQCFVTAIVPVSDGTSNRPVYYRVGANTGPGFDAATGRHAAVFLFQGTSVLPGTNLFNIVDGGRNGPGATWSTPRPITATTVSRTFSPSDDFGRFYQVATIAALVNAGYTVIQAAARRQANGAFFWDANQPNWNESTTGPDAPDQILMDNLVARIQPGSTTFGAIDINHVYAMGISSGGFMTSRIANEYAAGLNNDGTVVSTDFPFRALVIHSAGYANCRQGGCNMPVPLPNPANPPTFFLHDPDDQIVDFAFQDNYRRQLDNQFMGGNPAYTVNGVREPFLRLVTFHSDLAPSPGHQWDDDPPEGTPHLSGDSQNLILQWFNSHH
jgi:hypothetical protein